jgi:hypothetical protein
MAIRGSRWPGHAPACPVLQIGCNADRAKGVTGGVGEVGALGQPLDHMQHVKSGHCPFAQPVVFAHSAEERSLLVPHYSSRAGQALRYSLRFGR